MKRFVAILLAILMAFTSSVAFATGVPSPTLESLYHWTPSWRVEQLEQVPAYEDLVFAQPMIQAFLGDEYDMYDAFKLHVEYRYAIVHYESPYLAADGNFLIILTNEDNTYYVTPILIEQTAVMDFTNIEPALYTVYVLHADEIAGI